MRRNLWILLVALGGCPARDSSSNKAPDPPRASAPPAAPARPIVTGAVTAGSEHYKIILSTPRPAGK
jgi:hypothetical protein